MFLNPNFFSNLNYNCSNLLDLRNLQKQVKKAFCHQKLFWPFTVWINCSSDFKNFENSRPSASNFKSFSLSQEQFFLTEGQSNFGNKIPYLWNCVTEIPISWTLGSPRPNYIQINYHVWQIKWALNWNFCNYYRAILTSQWGQINFKGEKLYIEIYLQNNQKH